MVGNALDSINYDLIYITNAVATYILHNLK